MTTKTAPATEAFDLLREYASPPTRLPVRLLDGSGGAGAWFRYEELVADQSAAFPHRRIEFTSRVFVVVNSPERLTLHMRCDWTSIFGCHQAWSEYAVTKSGDDVTIVPQWRHEVPAPTLDNIDIHAGGVSAEQYHDSTITSIKARGGRISTMLAVRGMDRAVPLEEFVALSAGLRNTIRQL